MTDKIQQTLTIPDELAGLRFDQALTKLMPNHSRTQIQEWIKNQNISLNGKFPKVRDTVLGGEVITIDATLKQQPIWEAQNIALNIVYEDTELLVINKPAGMVVHPAAGNANNTLLNALLHHAPSLQKLPRAGIIHRLDKETTGLLVIAKTPTALTSLTAQLKARTISRIYQTVVAGLLISGNTIKAPMARHPIQRKRMAVSDAYDLKAKPAITHYRVMEQYRAHTRLKVQLETGRTHQIRVHMAHIHHAVVGDPVYGGRLQLPKGASPELVVELRGFKRQALHAYELGLIHPLTQEHIQWRAPLPADMLQLIRCLRADIAVEYDEDE
jgi:23S rRNA pseudouridine1911/1915/1917 synthase